MSLATTQALRPLLFCDLDDVLCRGQPYGCVHARNALIHPETAPSDLWQVLFEEDAVRILNILLEEFNPHTVISSSWLAYFDREQLAEVFNRTGLERLGVGFHDHWDAPALLGMSRLEAIDTWLDAHQTSEAVLILDDVNSGESLIGSFHEEAGRALLCQPGQALHMGMLDAARRALSSPYSRNEPWKL